ncbi:MAG: hypothetical protein ACR2OD_04965, partial [Gaiellaceae bacterium]
MNQLSIRLRLTLVFAGAMAVVLAAVGTFLYFRLESELNRAINDGLRSRAADIGSLLQSGAAGLDGVQGIDSLTDDSFTQILDADGGVLAASSGFADEPTLTNAQLERALSSPLMVDVGPLGTFDDGATRLLGSSTLVESEPLIVVVGRSLEERNEALNSLLAQLLVIAPIALLVTSGLGYIVALAALRPVDA